MSSHDAKLMVNGVNEMTRDKSTQTSKIIVYNYLRKMGMDDEKALLRADAVVQVKFKISMSMYIIILKLKKHT